MTLPHLQHGTSADVELWLVVAEKAHALSHVGPDRLTLREPAKLSPGEAELVVRVDGDEDRSIICISPPDGQVQAVPYADLPRHDARRGLRSVAAGR